MNSKSPPPKLARTRRRFALAAVLSALVLLAADEAPEPEADRDEAASTTTVRGRLIRLPLPITGNVDRRVVQQIRRALPELKPGEAAEGEQRPVLILEFAPGQTEFGLGSEFEDSLKLARFLISAELNQVKTVAFLPRPIKGHAVLVAMACEQIIMSNDAAIGEAGAGHDEDNPIDATITSGYEQIARSRNTVPVAVALGMLDAKHKLLKVETEDGPQLVFAKDLDALRATKTIDDEQTEVIFPAGQMGMLDARQARDLGVTQFLAPDRRAVGRHLGLTRNSMKVSPLLGDDVRARMILVKRRIDDKLAETRLRMIDDAIRNDRANLICLWIDSGGGDIAAALRLAGYLADTKTEEVMTVAFVPKQAEGAAALIALACDDVVMRPSATLGGGEPDLSDEQLLDVVAAIDEQIAPNKSRSKSLLAAMFKEDISVFRYTSRRTGLVKFFSADELEGQPDKDDWQRGEEITDGAAPLLVDGAEAEELDLASFLVDDFSELKAEYGLENDPELAEPTWVDTLVRALASPGLAWLLLMIGLTGMYAELQMPGIGVGGFVAAVAFTLFFWSNFLEGTAGALEIVLFLVGLSCLVMEVFIIPGFGIFGLGGGLLVLTSLILASQTFVLPRSENQLRELRDSLLIVGGAGVGLIGIAIAMRHYLPSAPLFNRLMLPPPEDETLRDIDHRESLADYGDLVGARGTTTTQLTPSGKASIDDELIDVISDGDLIPLGAEIEVVEVRGTRVLVRAIE